MVVPRFALPFALIALLGGCPAEETASQPAPVDVAPAASATTTADPDPAAGLFGSSVDEIVMKDTAPSLGLGKVEEVREPDDLKKKRLAAEKKAAQRATAEDTGGRTLTAAQVKGVIKSKTPQVRACYEKELKKRDGLKGKVVMSWTIGASGKVSRVRVVRNSTRNSTMVPCMIRAVSTWTFPKAEASFDVEYPFVFRPRDY
jgi:TonB family protein